jgi:glucosamine--fructose-6-phosphate aminotransferase (isomerizing)
MPASGSPVQSTHTLAEILSQPEVWLTAIGGLSADPAFQEYARNPASGKQWLFVGCGTSFYLAEAAAACWTLLTGEHTHALPASELLLFPQLCKLDSSELQAVVISRSGRTSEAVRAAKLLVQTYKVHTLGITCAPESELPDACHSTLALPSANEKSMVMTRSFTSMLLGLIQLAASRSRKAVLAPSFEAIASALSARIQKFSLRVEAFVARSSFSDYIYLAQGPFFAVAREAALKITEMSCSYAQAYHTLEFRHGPKSIVSPQTCLTFFLSESGIQEEMEVLEEMKELGGTIIAICNRATDLVRRSADLLLELEADAPEVVLVAPFVVPAQLLGFHTGIKKGFNPDQPKNLSHVVILD